MVRLNHGRGAYGLEMGWDERAWLLGPLPVSVYTGGFPTERGGWIFRINNQSVKGRGLWMQILCYLKKTNKKNVNENS